MDDRAPDTLVTVMTDLVAALVDGRDTAEILDSAAERATALVGADDGAIMLAGDDEPRVVAATSHDARVLDLLQLREHQGPCLQALTTGKIVAVPDLVARPTWERWSEGATSLGYAGVVSVPLRYRDETLGTSIALWREPAVASGQAERDLAALADVTTLVLLGARRADDAERTAAQLQSALDSRVVIEQAKGLLAGRLGVTPTEAFSLLRNHARSTRRPLRDVAHDVVHNALTL